MDMRIYYRKIHEIEQSLPGEWTIVMSLETPEGGRAGVACEVSKRNAARLIVENRARLATDEEIRAFRTRQQEAKHAADEAAAAGRVQMSIISSAELQSLRGGGRPPKA
jgi:hypothetical protein